MKKELAFKIIKSVICVLLSFIFVLGLAIIPLYYSITVLAKPESVAMVIQEIDYKEVIKKNPKLQQSLEKYGVSANEADKVMKSKEAGEILQAYTDKITQVFLDSSENKNLDVSHLKEIALENADEFIALAENETSLKLNKSKAKQVVNDFFENNEVVIEESIEVIKEVKEVAKTLNVTQVIHKKFSIIIAISSILIAFIIIAVIILLMRSYGFLWVGINFSILSIIFAIIIGVGKSGFVNSLASNMPSAISKMFESAISISAEKMTIALFAAIIMALIFIGFFVVLKLLKRKYQQTTVN